MIYVVERKYSRNVKPKNTAIFFSFSTKNETRYNLKNVVSKNKLFKSLSPDVSTMILGPTRLMEKCRTARKEKRD